MKKIVSYAIIFITMLQACNKPEKPFSVEQSNIDVSKPDLSPTDQWIITNYVDPYNIDIEYEWNENRVDLYRYLIPPHIEKVVPVAKIIKKVWIDSYTEVGGDDFIKKIAPRELVFSGGTNLNSSGTITLGFAEAGVKIVLFDINTINFSDKQQIYKFVGTIQHEYTHILNQTRPFDEKSYESITPGEYTSQWYNYSDAQARELGFITAYARAEPKEDFAEMVRVMLSNTKEEYDYFIDYYIKDEVFTLAMLSFAIKNGRRANLVETLDLAAVVEDKVKISIENLRKKERMIVKYFKDSYNIDFYKLQEVVAKNMDKIVNP